MIYEEVVAQFLKHQPMLTEYIRYLVRDPVEAQDVLQDVAVIVMKKDSSSTPEAEKFGAWCRGIARNVARRRWRDRKTSASCLERFAETLEVAYREADEDADLWNRRRRLLELCMRKLPEHAARLLRRHYWGGERIVQIAAQLGQTPEALRMSLMRVRAKLMDCVRAQAVYGGSK